MVAARIQNSDLENPGITLEAVPPSKITPFTLSSVSNNGRSISIWLNTLIAAVRALMPVAGAEEWADCPVKEMVRLPEALPFRLI